MCKLKLHHAYSLNNGTAITWFIITALSETLVQIKIFYFKGFQEFPVLGAEIDRESLKASSFLKKKRISSFYRKQLLS